MESFEKNRSLIFSIGIAVIVFLVVFILAFSLTSKNKTNNYNNQEIKKEEVEVKDEDLALDDDEDEKEPDVLIIGAKNYGYLKLTSDWTEIYEAGGTHALQYSYKSLYTVSLDYFEDGIDAKTHANSYANSEKQLGTYSDISGARSVVGSTKEYNAYQVYGYNKSLDTYKITYWIDGEDKLVHLITLEGPKELDGVKITNYTSIPKSFSLTKITE